MMLNVLIGLGWNVERGPGKIQPGCAQHFGGPLGAV